MNGYFAIRVHLSTSSLASSSVAKSLEEKRAYSFALFGFTNEPCTVYFIISPRKRRKSLAPRGNSWRILCNHLDSRLGVGLGSLDEIPFRREHLLGEARVNSTSAEKHLPIKSGVFIF